MLGRSKAAAYLALVAFIGKVGAKSEACETCNCFWRLTDGNRMKYIDCSGLGLTEIPSGINTWVHNLALQGNDIEDLGLTTTLGSETLEGIEHINLSNNPIRNVTSGFFDVVPNLKSLMLHHTEIHTLPSDVFDPLTQLEWLWLHENQLQRLHVNTFKKLTNLYELYLHNNNLAYIFDGLFSSQKKIRHIHLHGNNIGMDAPSCCKMCGLPDGVDVKWGDVPQDTEMNCGCGSESCTSVGGGVCNDPAGSTLTCANYKFSAAGSSWSLSWIVTLSSIVLAWCAMFII